MRNAQGHSIVANKIVPDTDATWLKSSGKKEKLATCFQQKGNRHVLQHQRATFWNPLQYFTCVD